MTVIATGRAILSDLLAGVEPYSDDTMTNKNLLGVAVGGSTNTVGFIGQPLIWDDVAGNWDIYDGAALTVAAALADQDDLPVLAGYVVALSVGDKSGLGFNRTDITLSAANTAVNMTAIYRGDATVNDSGIVWGATSAPNQLLFWAQLEAQQFIQSAEAAITNPSYNS
jgi:hypothetical protein